MNDKKTAKKMISLMAKQSLKASRMRNLFVMITIVLASALLTGILMFAAGQNQRIKNALSHRQQVGYYNLTDKQITILQNDERVAYQIQVKTGILSEMGGFDVMPYYVSELSDYIQVGELESGRLPEAENEIAVQAALLKKMDREPNVGSSVTFTFYDGSQEDFIVSGILKGSDKAKQFLVFFSESYAESGSQLKDMPYEIYAKLYHAESLCAKECKEQMYLIGKDAGIERKNINPSKTFLDSLSVDINSVMLYSLIGAVILLSCVLVIYGVFYLSVIGRIHQFGQLRTIGMTKKQLKKFVSCEGRMLFLRSAPVGIIIGGTAGYLMVPDGFSLWNTFAAVVLVFAVIDLITMVSVRKPARLAAEVSPMEALRYLPQDEMKKAKNKKLCRRLTPLGLGMMNFSKNKKKAVITMLSLSLGGILFMTAATYISSFDRENFARQGYFKDAEFYIYYPSSAVQLEEYGMSGLQEKVPMDEKMIEEISALDGVIKVEGIKNFGIRFDYPKGDEYGDDDVVCLLTEEELKEIENYLADGSADYEKLVSGDYILVADNNVVEEVFGWKFAVDDKILLHYYDGEKMAEKEVTILGILNEQYSLDRNGLEGWFLMPEQAVFHLVSYHSFNNGLLVSTEADKEEAVGINLEEMIAERAEFSLETLAERKIIYGQNASSIFGMISGLSIFIMVFSILSMMNTLITNIVTRKQELAMLESIGMGKGQMRRMLFGESLLLICVVVGITLSVGTLCGYMLSHLLYKMGAYYMAFQFPMVFTLLYIGVLVAVPVIIVLVSMYSFSKEVLVVRLREMEN